MKIVYSCDWHLRSSVPEYRKESLKDFIDLQLKKVKEFLALAEEDGGSFGIIGGDIFDRYDPEYSIVNEIIPLFREYEKKGYGEIYVVIGNHDISGCNIDTLRRSGVGVLIESGVVRKLGTVIFSDKGKELMIQGMDYKLDINPQEDFMIETDKYNKDYFKILVPHTMIVPKGKYPFACIPCDEVKSNADVVLCSHWHKKWAEHVGKIQFYNPGCLMRESIAEVDNIPQFLVLEINGKDCSVEFRKVKCAKVGTEVFDIERVEELKKHFSEYSKFIDSLKGVSLEEFSVDQLIDLIGKEEGVEKDIIKEAKRRVLEAEEALKG